jgi:CheY-like chemotaxis protein
VTDLPSDMRDKPESVAQLWVAAEEAVAQLTRISKELRTLASGSPFHCSDAASHDDRDSSALPHCHVLVVEDQEIVRRAIVFLLQEAGQSCDVAENARAAAERLQLESFDLVLLDRNLPDMKAEQLAVQIHARKPHLPLVLVTGDDVGGGVQGVRWTDGEGHFMAMIAKPVTLAQVRWLLAEIAEAKKKTSEGHEST